MSINDILQLSKFRLTTSVVFSAIAGYFIAGGYLVSLELLYLIIGGFMVVASSNGFNQIMEKDLDSLMERTSNRPLPKQRMPIIQAYYFSLIMGSFGVLLLFMINLYCGFFGLLSLLLYVLAYTPLKRKTSFSVFVGALPGAIPFMLGWVAVTNNFAIEASVLFAIQFIWQFPHFWAIAWVSNDDYNRAGFKMLPAGKDKNTASKTLIYTFFLIPLSLLPAFSFTGKLNLSAIAAVISVLLGLWFFTKALMLFKTLKDEDARKLMFASFIYLPLLQLIYVFDKLLL
ncbi:MAG: heme o synthase [Bacteroidota bacterium]|nr:heme o synthase [Bacteroidota bacterium]MEE3037378.1 heme o synthase [Bacteroidota bacterium]